MNTASREVYLISDLHLGGAQPATSDPNDRGFRICTHGQELAKLNIVRRRVGNMSVLGIDRIDGKARIVAFDEGRQPRVCGIDGINAGKAQGFDQAVLRDAIGALDPAFGLR